MSDVSYSIDFPEQRFRWDCFDEFSAPMREMNKSSNALAHGAALMLVKIFSINGGFFPGTKAVTRGEKTGRCFGPAVCTMAAVQPDVFAENASYEMFANGFLTRFLCVYANEKTASKKRPKDMNDLHEVEDFLSHFSRLQRLMAKELRLNSSGPTQKRLKSLKILPHLSLML